jgi:hypothetical protein
LKNRPIYFCRRNKEEANKSDDVAGPSNLAAAIQTANEVQPEPVNAVQPEPANEELHFDKPPSDISHSIDDGPCQPRLRTYPWTTTGSQRRAFCPEWFCKYKFLEYSCEKDAVFCFVCRMFSHSSQNDEVAFTVTGFRNWKKVLDKICKHSECRLHKECVAQWLACKQTVAQPELRVMRQVGRQAEAEIKNNRGAVETLARIVLLCGRQDLALRGHSEIADAGNNNRGNFLEILDVLKTVSVEVNQCMTRLPLNATYCSKDSQNDLLESCANVIKGKILNSIKTSGMYAIIVDEARDASRTEQMSICIRYVEECFVKERFLGFVHVTDLTAKGLAEVIVRTLNECGLILSCCIAQCYDGASVMAGINNGVQAKVRELTGSACVYVHCYAHRVNLVLVDTCTRIVDVSDFFGLLEATYAFVSVSTIRHERFVSIQKEKGLPVLELSQQSDTRWVCKHKGVKTFMLRFAEICATLEYFAYEGKAKERAEAKGLLLQLKSVLIVFFLHVFDECLSIVHSLSLFLQSKSVQFSQACDLVLATTASLQKMRTDEYFLKIFLSVKDECKKYDIDLEDQEEANDTNTCASKRVKRTSQIPQSLNDSVVLSTLGKRGHREPSLIKSNARMKHCLFEIIDSMCGELDRRFAGNEQLLLTCDTLKPDSSLFLNAEQMNTVIRGYPTIGIESDKLLAEVSVAKEMLTRKQVQSADEVVQTLFDMKLAFPNLIKICQFIFTLPVSSASAERSFSTMKRVKNYLRSTMSDKRLNNLCLLSIEHTLSKQLLDNPSECVDYFAKMKDRRLQLL